MPTDPLKPGPGLLIALGSALIHFEEFESEDGRPVDLDEARRLMAREDVQAWLAAMNKAAFLPVKRDKTSKPRKVVPNA